MQIRPAPTASNFVIEIEQDVLGACLVDISCFLKARPVVRDYHFIEPFHEALFKAYCDCYERFKSLSIEIIEKAFSEDEQTAFSQKVGKSIREYLVHLSVSSVTTKGAMEERAKAVVLQWARLQLAECAGQICLAANNPLTSVEALVSDFNSEANAILADCRYGQNRMTQSNLATAIDEAFQQAEKAKKNKGHLTGITWGLVDLNRLTGGLQKRDLTLVGARPSMGKTTFATTVTRAAAKAGHGVGIISLEMDRAKLAARMASDIAYDANVKIPYTDIINGKISDTDFTCMRKACEIADSLPVIIDDQSGLTITDIRMKLEGMLRSSEASRIPFDLFIIDHLGLVKATNRYAGNRNNEIGEMTAALKSMAREYDVAIMLLSQLNRQLEQRQDKRPQLSDLRDSGAIEQDADTILFLHREAYYLSREKCTDFEKENARIERLADCQNTIEIQIAKQRNGPVTTVNAFIDIACAAVRNGVRL